METMSAKFLKIPEMIAAGKSTVEIARQIGAPEKEVRAWAIEAGVFKRVTPVGWWTDARIAEAKQLYTEGVSCSVIGERLGCSRNAIIGKLTRLGIMGGQSKDAHGHAASIHARAALRKRRSAAKKAKAQQARQEKSRARLAPVLDYTPLPASETEPEGCTSLIDLREDQCRWPYRDDNFVFCPADRVIGAYCLSHARKAINPVQPAPRARHHRSRMQ